MAYLWKVSFSIDSVELSDKWEKNNLHLFPEAFKDAPALSERHRIRGYCVIEIESDNQEEAMEKVREVVEGFVACYSILTRSIHVRISYILPPKLVNKEELEKLGKPIPDIYIGPLVLFAEAKLTPKELDLSYQMLTQVAKSPKSGALRVTLRWYRRAMEYRDPYDTFIALWISFNSFYNLYYSGPEVDDATKMEYLMTKLFDEAEAQNILSLKHVAEIVSHLISLKGLFMSKSGRTDWSEKLELELNAKKFKEALKYAVRCVYSIRKTLFHGDRDISSADRKLVEDTNPFLKEIVRTIILKYVTGKIL